MASAMIGSMAASVPASLAGFEPVVVPVDTRGSWAAHPERSRTRMSDLVTLSGLYKCLASDRWCGKVHLRSLVTAFESLYAVVVCLRFLHYPVSSLSDGRQQQRG